jgi:hypothetical protein
VQHNLRGSTPHFTVYLVLLVAATDSIFAFANIINNMEPLRALGDLKRDDLLHEERMKIEEHCSAHLSTGRKKLGVTILL